MSDENNKDYKEGRYFVFQDDLILGDEEKSMIEGSVLDFLPRLKETFAVSVGEFSSLTAEKKKRADNGSAYVLVRKATKEEEEELFRSDDKED